ncbi:MAG: hypothetical protein ACM3ZB_09345 [bacterium]
MPASGIFWVLEAILWLSTAAYAGLAFRMWRSGLHARYRFFFVFVLFRVIRAIALASVPFQRNTYSWIWFGTQPVLWILYILVLLELYGLVLGNYKGLATFGRWVVTAGLTAALIISSLTVGADLGGGGWESYPVLRYWSAIDRAVQSGLVIFLLIITAFLAIYPVTLSRNVLVHCVVYAIYFISGAAAMLVRNISASDFVQQAANVVMSGATLACIIAWLVLLNRKGEEIKVARRPQWRPEDEEQLMRQLASINATLLKAARR